MKTMGETCKRGFATTLTEQALRAPKKKLQRAGIRREMRLHGRCEKPSEKRTREKAEWVRRARKLARRGRSARADPDAAEAGPRRRPRR